MGDDDVARSWYDLKIVFAYLFFIFVTYGFTRAGTINEEFQQAATDLITLSPDVQRVTRYLSLIAIPEKDRESFVKSLSFVLNSTSFRPRFVRPILVSPRLIRINLEDLGWDSDSRRTRLGRLEKTGVSLAPTQQGDRERFVDIWETFAAQDPYFQVTQTYQGTHYRGWINPVLELSTRKLSYSQKMIVRADWLFTRLLVEKDEGGFYSAVMMFPPKENDLYKAFGVDIKLVESESLLKQGGAVLRSIVAHHNRELQQIPSLYGYDERFIWRTLDFAKRGEDAKNVTKSFAGTARHDGREIIGSLPNGLHWYYLANAAGNQVATVPPNIALDMRPDLDGVIRDRNVHNWYKCVSCHSPVGGIHPFDDTISRSILNKDIGLAVISYDKKRVAALKGTVEDYYLSDLTRKIARQNESYTARLKDCNGLNGDENANYLVSFFDRYNWDLVTPEQAALEMNMSQEEARSMWKLSGNDQLVLLYGGQSIDRAEWERSFRDAMRVVIYPWENRVEPLKKVESRAY